MQKKNYSWYHWDKSEMIICTSCLKASRSAVERLQNEFMRRLVKLKSIVKVQMANSKQTLKKYILNTSACSQYVLANQWTHFKASFLFIIYFAFRLILFILTLSWVENQWHVFVSLLLLMSNKQIFENTILNTFSGMIIFEEKLSSIALKFILLYIDF